MCLAAQRPNRQGKPSNEKLNHPPSPLLPKISPSVIVNEEESKGSGDDDLELGESDALGMAEDVEHDAPTMARGWAE